jgi:glutaredoxin 3
LLKLYQTEWCHYCRRVRERLDKLEIECEIINVPDSRFGREELLKISGQTGVPTMVTDNGLVIADDDDAIIAYLDKHYGA